MTQVVIYPMVGGGGGSMIYFVVEKITKDVRDYNKRERHDNL